MDPQDKDPVTGRRTTGHDWNGIKELDTPVPRVVLAFLAVTTLFAIGYWLLMPAWPTGRDYTRGLLGHDDRAEVTRQVQDAAAARAAWSDRVVQAPFEAIVADEALMRHVMDSGRTLFIDNCAACHGVDGRGGPGFPDLAAGAWLWGGEPETLAETIRVGINSNHPDTRPSQMLGFGALGVLNRDQVRAAGAYVRSLSDAGVNDADRALIGLGREVYGANCAVCHGESGRGDTTLGAPDLTDGYWLYGGDAQSVVNTIHAGRQGHMPHWEGRLTAADIRMLAVYVGTLGEARR